MLAEAPAAEAPAAAEEMQPLVGQVVAAPTQVAVTVPQGVSPGQTITVNVKADA